MGSVFLWSQGELFGPVTLEDFYKWLSDGRLTCRDWVWFAEHGDWHAILEFPEFVHYFYSMEERPTFNPAMLDLTKTALPEQHTEDRKYTRIPYNERIYYREADEFKEVTTSFKEIDTIDISVGGLALLSEKPYTLNDTLEVTLDIFGENVNSYVKVVRCIDLEDGTYNVGVRFYRSATRFVQVVKELIAYLTENPT